MRNLTRNPFYGVIKEYEHWVVLFRDKQVTIGSVIIMSKNLSATSLADLDSTEWSSFGAVCKDVEGWLKNSFGAEKFNYLALMMVDAEVHFHVIPRYSKPVKFNGDTYTDTDWPGATKRVALDLDDNVLQGIQDKLIAASSLK